MMLASIQSVAQNIVFINKYTTAVCYFCLLKMWVLLEYVLALQTNAEYSSE
jgi:hypothetical protein